jgi:hypothetical protein
MTSKRNKAGAPSKPPEIDPLLTERIREAGDTGEVEAVILVRPAAPRKPPAPPKKPDERGPAGAVIDRVSKKMNEKPSSVRYLPRLGGAVVKANGRMMSNLVADRAIVSATVSDADMYGSVL